MNFNLFLDLSPKIAEILLYAGTKYYFASQEISW